MIKKYMLWKIYLNLVLAIVAYVISNCQADGVSHVTLTVEGGVSLVGEHCPGTVRLFCEGVDLAYLRWSYNSVERPYPVEIHSFIWDNVYEGPFVQHVSGQNPAFLTIQIVDISRDLHGRANFSTILTMNLAQLAQQEITRISCGELVNVIDSVSVNVSILRPSFIAPWTLNITNVVATYQFGNLSSVEVHWTKLNPACSEFRFEVLYEVNLTLLYHTTVNHKSCNSSCSATFVGDFVGPTKEYRISVRADNFLKLYRIPIGYMRQQYYIPKIVTTSCHIAAQCRSSPGYTNGECTIMYTTNRTYEASSYTIPMDTVALLPYLAPGLVSHYLYFVVNLDDGLSINEDMYIKVEPTLVPDTPEITSLLGVYSNRGQLEYVEVTWASICGGFRGDPVHYSLVINDTAGETLYRAILYGCMCLICRQVFVVALGVTLYTTA